MYLRSADISSFENQTILGKFEHIRAEIRAGRCRGQSFRKLIAEELGMDRGQMAMDREETGYDERDVFVNRIFNFGEMPAPTIELAAEMVEFYKTPARIVVNLAHQLSFGPGDVFVDLGAGLGQVVMLVHLLTGVRALGVEIEPAYCVYARRSAAELGLTGVSFVSADARVADLSAGTVFFLFTPFKGEIFSQVMEQLRMMASSRDITVIGYGPCTEEMARLDWLRREGGFIGSLYSLQIFSNLHAHEWDETKYRFTAPGR
jgi:precorrin-6B methylase 2